MNRLWGEIHEKNANLDFNCSVNPLTFWWLHLLALHVDGFSCVINPSVSISASASVKFCTRVKSRQQKSLQTDSDKASRILGSGKLFLN